MLGEKQEPDAPKKKLDGARAGERLDDLALPGEAGGKSGRGDFGGVRGRAVNDDCDQVRALRERVIEMPLAQTPVDVRGDQFECVGGDGEIVDDEVPASANSTAETPATR
jgi:hypothetical protein